MNQLPDNELLILLKSDDNRAYEELFHRYWKETFTLAHRKCGNEQEALDIVQNIFFQLWENRKHLSITGSFAAWLYTVVKYKVIDWYRSTQTREVQKKALYQQLVAQSAAVVKENTIIHYRELSSDWETAVNNLPERMREVYLMRYQVHLSIGDIAQQLSLTPQSVKNHLQKAKVRLRKMLSHHLPIF
ncbi:sigma-70 family RNA polymerase sigma factor [Chitinophaga pendula]|uniref:RNA polymerase sigma factor n=1 Tax=Chitinophaga TaxID=79328 RepID=UPI0012FE23D7|nr:MULTISPECIES: sigma-70 family RNA polymerase sigma factor [Chitinophaga]UCJ08700.1 sigma-70 family RNA polymerase sigma factor [Chitinophaga pendula]